MDECTKLHRQQLTILFDLLDLAKPTRLGQGGHRTAVVPSSDTRMLFVPSTIRDAYLGVFSLFAVAWDTANAAHARGIAGLYSDILAL
jgi:hypothetical protein